MIWRSLVIHLFFFVPRLSMFLAIGMLKTRMVNRLNIQLFMKNSKNLEFHSLLMTNNLNISSYNKNKPSLKTSKNGFKSYPKYHKNPKMVNKTQIKKAENP